MTGTHTVPGGIGHGDALETCVSDVDLQRSIDAEPPAPCSEERPPEPPHSTEVMDAYERAKRAGEAWDMRSRRIVRQQWREREGDDAGAPALVGQTALFDFKESR